MSALRAPSPPGPWLPTHVSVTVLRARGLRLKGRQDTCDAFTIIQLGRERYSTTVAEKSPGHAEWSEECSFELPPGAPELLLTAMHRALIGMDKFLGQVSLPLARLQQEARSCPDTWYKLQSKPGKKEKERGEIQVSIKFTRNNMTASMFDLSMKDKPRTPFGKLKDKIKGKKKYDMESASAIVSSSVGKLDSDDEDFQREMGDKKSKSKGFFLKGKLRKSSLTGSNASLRSNNSISSTGGTNTDLSILVPEMTKKPAHRNSSVSTDGYDNLASPRQTHKRAFSDDVSQINGALPEPKVVHNLKPKSSPISKSSLCVNGTHVYIEEPAPKTTLNVLEPSTLSRSSQNIAKKPEEIAIVASALTRSEPQKLSSSEKMGDPKLPPPVRSTPEESKVSTKAVVLNHPSSKAKMEERRPDAKPVQIATPMIISVDSTKEKPHEEAKKEDKKPKVSLFHHGSGKSDPGSKSFVEKIGPAPTHSTHVAANPDERSKTSGWFGSKDVKDATQKPSFPSGSNATSEADEGVPAYEQNKPSNSTRSLGQHEDFSGIRQAARSASDHIAASIGPKIPSEMTPKWDDPFDAFATSRLIPESKERRLSTPLITEELSKVNFYGSHNAPLRVVAHLKNSETIAKKPDFQENEPVVIQNTELQSESAYSTVQESLFNVSDVQETEANLQGTPQEQNVMGKSMLPSLPGSSIDPLGTNVIPPVTSARLRTSTKSQSPPLLVIKDTAKKRDEEVAYLERHAEQYEGKMPSMPFDDQWNVSGKKLTNLLPEDDSDTWKRDVDQNKQRGYTFENILVLETVNALPNLSESVQGPFSKMPPIRFESKSENKIAAVPPLVLKDQAGEKLADTIHRSANEGRVAHKEHGKDFHPASQGVLPDGIQPENMSSTQTIELSTEQTEAQIVFASDSDKGTYTSPQETEFHRDLERTEDSTPSVGLQIMQLLASPPKPPRCFMSSAFEGEENEAAINKEARNRDKEDGRQAEKQAEGPKEDMWDQNTKIDSEQVSLVPPCPPFSGAVIEENAERPATIYTDSELATKDLLSNLSKRVNESAVQDTSNGENMFDTNEVTLGEQFKTCSSKLSLDGLDLSRVENSSKLDAVKPGLASDLIGERQSKQPDKLDYSGEQGKVRLDLLKPFALAKQGNESIPEMAIRKSQTDHSSLFFWSALEDQLQTKEHSHLSHATQINPLAQNGTQSVKEESSATQEDNRPELAHSENVFKAINQTSKSQGPTFKHTVKSPCTSQDSTMGSNQRERGQEAESENTLRLSTSQQSSWSADMVADFKNVDFWKSESDVGLIGGTKPAANPFVSLEKSSCQSQRNPFVERPSTTPNETESSEMSFKEGLRFIELHQKAAPQGGLLSNLHQEMKSPFLHGSQPLAFSTPFFAAATNLQSLYLPSPIVSPTTCVAPTATTQAAALSSCYLPPSSGAKASSFAVLPQETQPAEKLYFQQKSSPHPVKPISAAVSESSERKQQKSSLTTALSSGLEKLRTATTGSVHPVAPSVPGKHEPGGLKDPAFPDLAAKYYHLTHDELIHMLLQREKELTRKDEHLQELETYIDQLLVRIMDQAPTLLQIPLEQKK